MKADLTFLPDNLRDDPKFQTAWRHAVMVIHAAAQGDAKGRGGDLKRKAIQAAADRTKGAAILLRDEIDRGAFAGFFPVEDVGCSPDYVQTVRHFLGALGQHLHVAAPQTVERIPDKAGQQAKRLAGYFAGRLCAQFGLGTPTNYVSAYGVESVAIRLMRGLLIDVFAVVWFDYVQQVAIRLMRGLIHSMEDYEPSQGEDYEPNPATLRRGMDIAKQGFAEFRGRKTSA